MVSITRAAAAVAAILVREGVDYAQSKAVFKAARQRASLYAPAERRGGVDRLTVEEELRFLDQAYAQSGRTGLMLQTLLETGARASELVQLRVEDVSLAERPQTILSGSSLHHGQPYRIGLVEFHNRQDRQDPTAAVYILKEVACDFFIGLALGSGTSSKVEVRIKTPLEGR